MCIVLIVALWETALDGLLEKSETTNPPCLGKDRTCGYLRQVTDKFDGWFDQSEHMFWQILRQSK
jgi:hypothetical protein